MSVLDRSYHIMTVLFNVLRLGSLFLLCPLIQALYAQLNIKIDNSQIDRSGMSVTHSYAPILSKSPKTTATLTEVGSKHVSSSSSKFPPLKSTSNSVL